MKTKLILELGCNHNGSMDNARKMIDQAAELGVAAVKFQKRDIDSIPEPLASSVRDTETSFGMTYREHREALEFSPEQLFELIIYADKLNVSVGVTVFDSESVISVIDLPLAFIKLPSQKYADRELNAVLFAAINAKGSGTMTAASTGMHQAVELTGSPFFGKHDITFYCRSMYPFPPNKARLDQMLWLSKVLPANSALGYSSHDRDGLVIPWAVALGARYVERHFTLDRNMKGADHRTVSSTFCEMQDIMESVRTVEKMLDDQDQLDPDELRVRKQFRGF